VGIPTTVITYHCVSTCFLSAVIMMSEQVAALAVAYSIMVKFITNENVKLAEILIRPKYSSVMKRSRGPRFMTGVSHEKKTEQKLKTCEDYTFCRERYGQRFLGLLRRLINRFSDRTTKHHCSLLYQAS
jgi:hypothetical protein